MVTSKDDKMVDNVCGVNATVDGNCLGAEDVDGINNVSGVVDACVGIDSPRVGSIVGS